MSPSPRQWKTTLLGAPRHQVNLRTQHEPYRQPSSTSSAHHCAHMPEHHPAPGRSLPRLSEPHLTSPPNELSPHQHQQVNPVPPPAVAQTALCSSRASTQEQHKQRQRPPHQTTSSYVSLMTSHPTPPQQSHHQHTAKSTGNSSHQRSTTSYQNHRSTTHSSSNAGSPIPLHQTSPTQHPGSFKAPKTQQRGSPPTLPNQSRPSRLTKALWCIPQWTSSGTRYNVITT